METRIPENASSKTRFDGVFPAIAPSNKVTRRPVFMITRKNRGRPYLVEPTEANGHLLCGSAYVCSFPKKSVCFRIALETWAIRK